MEELSHMVQYRRTKQQYDVGWHTMAAFDCEQAAKAYMAECRESSQDNIEYRVRMTAP